MVCCDRFIPVRDRNLATEFSLIGEPRTPSRGKRNGNGADISPQSGTSQSEIMVGSNVLLSVFAEPSSYQKSPIVNTKQC